MTDFILKAMVSFRPGFQDEYTLMFAKMFLWVHSLFQKIPKWFAFFTYLMWIKIFTVVLRWKLLSLKAISVKEVEHNGYGVRFLIPYPWSSREIFLRRLISALLILTWTYFCRSQNPDFSLGYFFRSWKNLFLKTLFFFEKRKRYKQIKRQLTWIYTKLISLR